MANTLSAAWDFVCAVTETIDVSAGSGVSNPSIRYDLDLSGTQTGSSTDGPVTKIYTKESQALAGGTYELDLDALTDMQGNTLSLNGLKPQIVLIKASADNSDFIDIEKAAVEGYDLLGSTAAGTSAVHINQGGCLAFFLAEGNAGNIVSDTTDKVKFDSTDATAEFDIMIVAG